MNDMFDKFQKAMFNGRLFLKLSYIDNVPKEDQNMHAVRTVEELDRCLKLLSEHGFNGDMDNILYDDDITEVGVEPSMSSDNKEYLAVVGITRYLMTNKK